MAGISAKTSPSGKAPQSRLDAATQRDLDLLQCFANYGDTDSFTQIVKTYSNIVYGTCLRVLGNSARAEDATQETFFKLMTRPHDVTQNLGAWLHRTATHVSVDMLRSESARKRREIVYTEQCDRDATTWAELSPAVDQAISELPEELRTLLVRHFLLGQSQAQLAQETEQSPATISRRIRQGLDELRIRLRLKGIVALSATLAAMLVHVSARQAPASVMLGLGKITMVGGTGLAGSTLISGSAQAGHGIGAGHGAVAAQGGATSSGRAAFQKACLHRIAAPRAAGLPHAAFSPASHLATMISNMIKSQALLIVAAMAGALITLQFLTGAWNMPGVKNTHRQPEPETQMHQVHASAAPATTRPKASAQAASVPALPAQTASAQNPAVIDGLDPGRMRVMSSLKN